MGANCTMCNKQIPSELDYSEVGSELD